MPNSGAERRVREQERCKRVVEDVREIARQLDIYMGDYNTESGLQMPEHESEGQHGLYVTAGRPLKWRSKRDRLENNGYDGVENDADQMLTLRNQTPSICDCEYCYGNCESCGLE